MVGNASAENKEIERKETQDNFSRHLETMSPQDREKVKKLEFPKSQIEVALIDFANRETDKLMEGVGVESYDIPYENYHIIPSELFNGIESSRAIASSNHRRQGMLFNSEYSRKNPLNFGIAAFHETLHLKSHFSIQVNEDGKRIIVAPYRTGVEVSSFLKNPDKGDYHVHFAGLHEAIVAEAEKRCVSKLLALPEFEKEREWLSSDLALERKKKIAEKKGVSQEEIIWVGEKNEADCEIVSYPILRDVLNYVCAEIQKEFPDKYENDDEVFKAFLKAHFTGQLLPIARLVEKTFGEGSFRLLGNMGTDKESGVLHLESLKKARARQTRK